MEAFFDIDSSYFKISTLSGGDISANVIDFSITEEIGKMTTGSITLFDPDGVYAILLKSGVRFIASWGYKRLYPLGLLARLTNNPLEFNSQVRPALQCIVTSPGGGGDANGVLTYSTQFIGQEYFLNGKQDKVYLNQTRQQVIVSALTELGVVNSLVNFQKMTETLNSNTYIRQQESTYKFLVRLAYEWRCIFSINTDATGNLSGIFVDSIQIGSSPLNSYLSKIIGTVGTLKQFDYGVQSATPNTISYSWQFQIGNSGQGDATQLSIVNGEVIATSYIAESQSTVILKLDENKLKDFVERNGEDLGTVTTEIIKAQSLDDKIKGQSIRSFFTAVKEETAPQGLGYSVNLEMIGDPALTPLIEARFGKGFPSQLTATNLNNKFYIKKVVHKINAQGYRCSVEIADALTIYGSYVS